MVNGVTGNGEGTVATSPVDEQGPVGGWIQSLRRDNDRLGTFYVEISASDPYKGRFRRILSRLRWNGYDARDLGTVTYGGYHYLLSALASVSISNEMRIGSAAGYEDWLLELVLAHEYRHLVQHDEAWRKIAVSKGLDPEVCPLKKAMNGRKRCPEFEPVAKAYDEWNEVPWRHILLELDAYLFAYDYFQEFLEAGLESGRVAVFLHFIQDRMLVYEKKLRAYEVLLVKAEEYDFVSGVLLRTADISNEITARLNGLNRPEVAVDIYRNVESYFDRVSGHLEHPDGTPFSLRSRLVFLQGASSYLGENADAVARIAGGNPGNLPLLGLTARVFQRTNQIDDLLSRQTFGYHYQVLSPYSHRVEYRNDYLHTNDGAVRMQDFVEVDFDTEGEGKGEAKIGEDVGVYIPWGAKAFFKIAPMLYAGANSEEGFNPILGTRLDLRFHYDLDWGQRWGTSVSVGYAVGAQLGFGGIFDLEFGRYSDFYDKADVSLEVFRF